MRCVAFIFGEHKSGLKKKHRADVRETLKNRMWTTEVTRQENGFKELHTKSGRFGLNSVFVHHLSDIKSR